MQRGHPLGAGCARTVPQQYRAAASLPGSRSSAYLRCRRRRLVLGHAAYYPPGRPRPLSELLAAPQQPPKNNQSSSSPSAPPSSAGSPPPAPGSSSSSSSSNAPANAGSRPASPVSAAGGLPPHLAARAAAAAAAAAANARSQLASPGPPGFGFSARPAMPSSPRGVPPLSRFQPAASAAGGTAVAPVYASAGPSASSAAQPFFTSAAPYEAFEPGDSGFGAPSSAEVVTSSSGSVMVKVSATFSGVVGDKVLMCGSTRALGNWEPDAAPSLTWGEGDVWTATLEMPPGAHEFKAVAVKAVGPPVWEPGNNRRVVVPRPGGAMPSGSGGEVDLVLGLLQGVDDGSVDEEQPDAQLVETSGGNTMVKLTTTYTASFGEYLKVVGGPPELGAWDAGAAPALTWGEGDVWTATLELPAGEHEFKYVVVRQDGRLEWEPGQNRRIHVPLPGLAAALAAAKAIAAAEDAAGGPPRALPTGRKLSAAEVYERQEASEQLEPWQQKAAANGHRRLDSDSEGTALLPAGSGSSGSDVPQQQPEQTAGWREVRFSTKFPAEFGTFLKAVGGGAQLGEWEVAEAPPLQWSEGDVWSSSLLMPPGTYEFKLVVVNTDGTCDWETGPNRSITVEPAAPGSASDAGSVLHAECQYGTTYATSSVWASLDEEEVEDAAAAAPAPAQQQPQFMPPVPPQQPSVMRPVYPTDWFSQQVEEPAAPAVPAAEQPQQQPVQQPAPPPPPPKPLQPLDAVVKVFKDRFAAASQQSTASAAAASPAASRPASRAASPASSAAASPASSPEATVDEEEQQQQPEQQQQQQQPDAGVGGRFASIIASRKGQSGQPPATLFIDRRQQQKPDAQQQRRRDEQQRREEQWRRQDSSQPSSSDGGSTRFDNFIPSHAQQQRSGPTPPWEQQPDGGFVPPMPEEQQQQQPESSSSSSSEAGGRERFADQIQRIKQRSPSPQQQQQPPAAAGPSSSDSSSSSSSRWSSWRSTPSPEQQQQQQREQQREPEPPAAAEPSSPPGDRWGSYVSQRQQDSSSISAAEEQQQQRRPLRRPTSPSWRSPSPVQDSSSSSSSSASDDASPLSSGRFSKYTAGSSWRSASPTQREQREQQQREREQQQRESEQAESQPEQQQQQQQPEGGRFSSYISGRSPSSSSSSSAPAAPSAADAPSSGSSTRFRSSWDAKEAGGGKGGDYLFELGQSDYNTNVDAGQNVGMIDSLFTGNVLGHRSDIADGSLRGWEARTLNHIIGDYYIAPQFMDKVAMHITKNYLADQGAISKSTKVPLIMGIWGPKGCGKTFQTELAFKKLGVEPIVMSAGELESETAGQPGRLIRERYRKAAELSKTRGKLSCLVINDLDAGIGRFGNTQVTVNNQIVIGTLMNICDDPNRVSIGANWRESDYIKRVPIIVTGNDFSTLYAPLIRDGRMEKFYWQPQREDVVNIVWQMYKEDGLARRDIETLIDTFGNQALDFFGALRAATYDAQIREWMAGVAGAPLHDADDARVKEVNKRLLAQQDLPEFEPVPLQLADLLSEGRRLVGEQEAVNAGRLGELYMKGVVWGEDGLGGWSGSEDSGDEEQGGSRPLLG